MKVSKEGNERILPILLDSKQHKLCIINCYLPSGNSSEAIQKFSSDLSVLEAITEKYAPTHGIIIGGDLNADLFNRTSKKETMLQQLINNYNLSTPNVDIRQEFTFNHKSMAASSHLDYFLVSKDICSDIELIKDSAINTSAHHPVAISTILSAKSMVTNARITTKRRVQWNKGDIPAYQHKLQDSLTSYNTAGKPIETVIQEINQIILNAESAAIPSTRSKVIRRPRKLMYPALADAIAESKMAHYLWKEAGRPGSEHPATAKRKGASKQVRRTQRQHEAERRNQLYNDIIASHEKDQSTFYRLLKRRHGVQSSDIALRLDGKLVYDGDIQRDAWANFYEELATPGGSDEPSLDLLRWFSKLDATPEVTAADVARAIKNLNSGKAQDLYSIQAEHFKYGGPALIQVTTKIINSIFQQCHIPRSTKTGYKLPIPKRGKDTLEMTNHRGITITAIIGKIIEHVIQENPSIGRNISGLQFGFEKGKSPTMATLCLTEAIAHAKDSKLPLFVASLDAQKAFDVVHHNTLKARLHYTGIRGHTWSLIDSLYTEGEEVVKWKGEYSRPYQVKQGVRQGGVLSTSLYKEYINPLLLDNEKARTGAVIGSVYLGTPTCADDILLLSNSPVQLQEMLSTAYRFSIDSRYVIHPGKSCVTTLIPPRVPGIIDQWNLGEDPIAINSNFTHLGITWSQKRSSPIIEDRITIGRRTAYMLIGRGINGSDGINPTISAKVALTQILPRMTHGLEATLLKKEDREQMDRAYKELLRQYQNLPDRVATCAVYLLTATYPASTHIDYKALLLYGAICRLRADNPLRQLAIRQLALAPGSSSWFVQLRKIARKYRLDLVSQWRQPSEPQAWKRLLKESVYSACHNELKMEATQKTTLEFLDLQMCTRNEPHIIWQSSIYSTAETKKASIRVKLLTGTYLLQTRVYKFKKALTPICPLCNLENEDTVHFVIKCPALAETRRPDIDAITQELGKLLDTPTLGEAGMVRAILNGGLGGVLASQRLNSLNKLCNNLIYNLHNYRTQKLENMKKSLLTKVVPYKGTDFQ